MKNIVCKFGGSSLASSDNIKLVSHIILSKRRKYVVVSAPGKRDRDDIKITDALINCYNKAIENKPFDTTFDFVKNRFYEIVEGLNIDLDLSIIFHDIYAHLHSMPQYDYIVSRGEYINALILSKYLNYNLIDAKDFIIFGDNGVDIEESKSRLNSLIHNDCNYVFPGFYGSDREGNIKTFSRGGSDITGAIISLLLDAKLYENYTDVDGIMSIDPRLNENAKVIPQLSFDEVRCLSFSGAQVLHADCTRFLKENKIPLHLLNTFHPYSSGSLVGVKSDKNTSLVGISRINKLNLVKITSFGINSNVKHLTQLLSILESEDIDIYHMMLGVDNMSFLSHSDIEKLKLFAQKYSHKGDFENISVESKVSILSVVGESVINCDEIEKNIYKILSETHFPIRQLIRNPHNPQIMLLVDDNISTDFMNYLHDELL